MNPAIRGPVGPGQPPKPRPPDLDWLNRLPLRDGLELKPDAIAPRKARQRLAADLEKWSLPQLGISAPLVLSEIVTNARAATNAVFAAYTLSGGVGAVPPVTVWLYGWPSAVAMLAWDASSSPPEPQCAGPDDEGGRGLAIIDLMSADWGYYFPAGIGGKITWAIVDRPLSARCCALPHYTNLENGMPCLLAVARAGSRNSSTSRSRITFSVYSSRTTTGELTA